MSRRVALVAVYTGTTAHLEGTVRDVTALADAVLEGRQKPRGHFLRLYRAGAWPERLTEGRAS
jgi:hypothetical protein